MELALNSVTLARSEQLRILLRYLCEAELSGRAPELSEYLIATEALGRPKDYQPGDSTVRNRVHSLRLKMRELYSTELKDAPLRIELPKGSYLARFVPWTPTSEGAHRLVERSSVAASAVPFVAGVLLAAAGAFLISSVRGREAVAPELIEAWGPLARPDGNALICINSPVHLRVRSELYKAAPADVPRISTPPDLYDWYREHQPVAPRSLYVIPTVNALPFGEALAAVALVRALTRLNAPVSIVSERMLSAAAMRFRNVFLIGAPEESSAVRTLLERAQLTVAYHPATSEYVVAARDKPEPAYAPSRDAQGNANVMHGLITVLPGEGPADDRSRTVIFSSGYSAGTQAAAEFFASPERLKELRDRFRHEGYATFPKAYQVVVKCRTDNHLLLSFAYDSHRVIGGVKE